MTSNGLPVRIVKNNSVLSYHLTVQGGFEVAHHGSLLQAVIPSTGIALLAGSDKKIIIEGVEDATFTSSTCPIVENVEIRAGTLIFR